MVDMNDPEVIESLKFLAVSKEEKIATGARPFDSKKNVFVPDHKEGFLEAEIQSTDESKGTVTAKTCKGEVNYLKRNEDRLYTHTLHIISSFTTTVECDNC